MKKRTPSLALALCLAALLLLFACGEQPGNTGPEPDFKSFYDTETGLTFSVDDPKSKFDEAFGEPEEFHYDVSGEDHVSFIYFMDRSLSITFGDNDIPSRMSIYYSPRNSSTTPSETAKRFEFTDGFKPGLTETQLNELYSEFTEISELKNGTTIYTRKFDENHAFMETRGSGLHGAPGYRCNFYVENGIVQSYTIFNYY